MTTIRSHVRFRKIRQHTGGVSYYPDELANAYDFPSGFDGTGQTVAVIELGGGFVQADLDAYFASRNLKVKPVKFVSVLGAANSPTTPDSADAEVMLDLEVVGGVAPGVQLACYMAPNTDQGFIGAIAQAVKDRVNAISISWGAPEDQWSAESRSAMDAAFQAALTAGIAVFVAAGDNGSGDGESGDHVDYPASSPFVTGCGGTRRNADGTETVWNDGANGGATGGGVSSVYPQPLYQSTIGSPSKKFRTVPDVAGLADPETGINVLVDGQPSVIGGTSAVAPLWAGLAAVLNHAAGKNVGSLLAPIYTTTGGLRDITQGNNGTFTARVGYDCCTGMGVPVGGQLAAILGGTAAPTPPPNPSQPLPPPPPTPDPTQPPASAATPLGTLIVTEDGGDIPAGIYTLSIDKQDTAAVSLPSGGWLQFVKGLLGLLGYKLPTGGNLKKK